MIAKFDDTHGRLEDLRIREADYAARRAANQMEPGEQAPVILPPRTGRYMMHCHNLVHEDHDMMVQFEVGSGGPDPINAAPEKPLAAAPSTLLTESDS